MITKKSQNTRNKGFTLVELIVVISLSGIVLAVLGNLIAQPIIAYVRVATRAQLVEAADQALRRLARDIQSSVPNSLRKSTNGSVISLEMLNIVEGMRYRVLPSPGGTQPALSFTTAGTSTFDTVQPFQYALSNATCQSNACRLVIYNTGATTNGSTDNPSPGANVYSTSAGPACATPGTTSCFPPPGSYTITPTSTTVTLSNGGTGGEGQVVLSSPIQFAIPSPKQRLYVSDTPVMYICSPSASGGTLTRYWGYPITQVQQTSAPTGSSNSQLAQFVTACSMTYQAGTTARNGNIIMSLTLSNAGETITLMRQVEVSNVP